MTTAYQPINPLEQATFNALWKKANPSGLPRIDGETAAAFFRQSQLPNDVLETIWGLTATTPDMDVSQFFSTLRLIAIAQENIKIQSLDQLSARELSDVGLPTFNGITIQVEVKSPVKSDSSRGDYYPTDETELEAYNGLWSVVNPNGDASIDGSVAVDFMKQSLLDNDVLRSIWALCTPNNRLDKLQFFAAVRYICMAQNGIKEISKAQLKASASLPMKLPMFEDIVFSYDDEDEDVPASKDSPTNEKSIGKGDTSTPPKKDAAIDDPPFSIRTTLPVPSSPEVRLSDPPLGRVSLGGPIVNGASVGALASPKANHLAPLTDDKEKISIARTQLAESSADFARTSARVRNDSAALSRVNSLRQVQSNQVSPLVRAESANNVAPSSGSFSLLQVNQQSQSQPSTLDRAASTGSTDDNAATITPLRSEISSLRGVLNTLTDHKASMANEMMILQARSEEYASALSRAQSQLVEKESHVLHLQSREALLLLEREALLREIAAMNDEISRMSKLMPPVDASMMELEVANQVADKWKETDLKEKTLQSSVDKVNLEVETLRKLLESLRKENSQTEEKLQAYLVAVEKNRVLLQAKEQEIQTLGAVVTGREQEREALMSLVMSERSKLPVLSAAIAAARSKLYDAQENSLFEAQMAMMDSQADSLNNAIAKVCGEVASLQNLLNSYVEDRVEMEAELRRIENETSVLDDSVEDAVYWFQSPHREMPSTTSEPVSYNYAEVATISAAPISNDYNPPTDAVLPESTTGYATGSTSTIVAAAITAADGPKESHKPVAPSGQSASQSSDSNDAGLTITRLHARDNYIRSLSHQGEAKYPADFDISNVRVHAMVEKIEEVIHHSPRASLSPAGSFSSGHTTKATPASNANGSSYLAPSPAPVPSPARAATATGDDTSTNVDDSNGSGQALPATTSDIKAAKPAPRQFGAKVELSKKPMTMEEQLQRARNLKASPQ